jgi:hypothetical protein
VPDKGALVEADALVIGAVGIFVLEIKHWQGEIVGTEVGNWTNNGAEVKNPVYQAQTPSQIVKSLIINKEHAKKIFVPAPRVAGSIRVWSAVVFWASA